MTNHKEERENDVKKIKDSNHPRKIVVAGPGTGKSFLFQELIKKKKLTGKSDFIAITFIGKLGDALADDLCGLATTYTMHGYARKFILESAKGWEYYPDMLSIIKEDLATEGITEFKIGDEKYKEKSVYYKAVGHDDVIPYAIQKCKNDPRKIPLHDLILIDEFQDFNEVEAEFVDILAKKNEVVIVGDDDQALYEFKGSSPSHIRSKHANTTDYESHSLRFCSRCTEVIIKYFHAIVEKFKLNDEGKKRIKKEYNYYPPDKETDSNLNPKVHLITNCPPGMIAYKIKSELEEIVEYQKIKDVLVIGEGRSCKSILGGIAKQLTNGGFRNVEYGKGDDIIALKSDVLNAYQFLYKDKDSLLAWRILGNPKDKVEKDKHLENAKTFHTISMESPSKIKLLKENLVDQLYSAIEVESVPDKTIHQAVLNMEIKNRATNLPRPLANLNITICNILNSKGLGADVVFVVGFDMKKFPVAAAPTDSEVYQMLVALTRAKKRIYFINTTGNTVSCFADCLDKKEFSIEKIEA